MVGVERPEFVPDPSLDRATMEELQRSIAVEARWRDDLSFDPAVVAARRPFAPERESSEQATLEPDAGERHASDHDSGDHDTGDHDAGDHEASDADDSQGDLDDGPRGGDDGRDAAGEPVIAAVDQAFREDEAVSVVIATRDGEVIERAHASAPLEIPYVPGLLAFREGGSILAALEKLSVEPDLLLVDGSGRIHYREAGLATHVGVTCDLPAVGVAKSLLCGEPTAPIDDLAVGDVVPIAADATVTAEDGTTIGAAVQTRQFDSGRINPLYVSPGHRVGWETAAELARSTTGRYKLPEPIRLADREVGELAAE